MYGRTARRVITRPCRCRAAPGPGARASLSAMAAVRPGPGVSAALQLLRLRAFVCVIQSNSRTGRTTAVAGAGQSSFQQRSGRTCWDPDRLYSRPTGSPGRGQDRWGFGTMTSSLVHRRTQSGLLPMTMIMSSDSDTTGHSIGHHPSSQSLLLSC